MTSKAMFTDDEWHTLQWAVTDTMAYVSMADSGFWDTFKEATAAAKFMAKAKSDSGSPLVHDLAGDIKIGRDKAVTHDMADMAGEVAARVRQAAELVAAKSPARPRGVQGLHPRRRAGDRRGRQGRRRRTRPTAIAKLQDVLF